MNEVGLNNCRISPLLSRVCDIKTIREEEKGWVRALNPGLNSYLPARDEETIEEYRTAYRESHKDAKKEYAKYCESHKDAKKGYNAKYYESHKDARKKYDAKYRESHKDAKKEYNAKYYGNNKGARRFYCGVCGVAFGGSCDLKRHLKTLKHSNAYMNSVD